MQSRAATSLALVAACAIGVLAQNPRTQHHAGPETFTRRVVASGLGNPWEVTWGPDDHLWITERTALRVIRLNPADGSSRVALTLSDVYQSVEQDGLMGMGLHPDTSSRTTAIAISPSVPTAGASFSSPTARARRWTRKGSGRRR